MTRREFGLFRFRSPLLTESKFLSLPVGTEMFQFPTLALPVLCIQTGVTGHDPSWVSPFGNPWICGWLTPPQGLSQPPTSFFASRCLGIHHMRFFTCRRDARARYGVLKQRATGPRQGHSVRTRPRVPRQGGCGSSKGLRPFRAAQRADTTLAGSMTGSWPANRLPPMMVPRTEC